jgi:hypothetical protein
MHGVSYEAAGTIEQREIDAPGVDRDRIDASASFARSEA